MMHLKDYKEKNCDMLIYEKGTGTDFGRDCMKKTREKIRLDYLDNYKVLFTLRVGGNKKDLFHSAGADCQFNKRGPHNSCKCGRKTFGCRWDLEEWEVNKMTNFEKFKSEIKKIVDSGSNVARNNGKTVACNQIMDCKECDFDNMNINCKYLLMKWLCEEYEEPKINLPKDIKVDTPILVSNDGENWHRRYFAKNEKDCVYTWDNGTTSWSSYHMIMAMSAWEYAKLPEEVE